MNLKNSIVVAASLLGATLFGAVVPGEWNDDFTASKAYADANGIPLVVVWGNQSCGFCNKLAEAIEYPEVLAWAAEHPVVLCHKHDPYQAIESKYSDDYKAAKAWIDGLDEDTRKGFPHVGVYWAKNTAGEKVSRAFTGRTGTMPATTPSGTSISAIAGQFANSLDLLLGDYYPEADGAFAMGDTDTDHLEINGLHATLTVPFKRDNVAATTQEKLVVSYPATLGLADVEYALNWASHQTEATVVVAANWRADLVGQTMTLSHYDADGRLLGTSHARYVDERACSVAYPRFIGEAFAYGEWTMDYAAATARAAQDGGYVLALFTGTMWCPYCLGLDEVFKDSRFLAWAQSNKVSLVTFDQALASSPATAEGTRQARLLSYEAGADHYAAGQDPYGSKVLRSGAYYLSGKGISKEAAEAGIALTTQKTAQWLSPESTAARNGNPTLLLIKNDTVVGRFSPLRNGYVYDIAETVGRFGDLLALNVRDDELDDYRTATTQTIEADSDCLYAPQLQISRRAAWYRLAGKTAGRYTFTVTGKTSDEDVLLSVYAAGNLLGSGIGEVTVDIGSSAVAEGVTLKVSAYANTSRQVCTDGKTSIFDVTLAATCEAGGGDEEDGPGFDPDGKPCFGWESYDVTLWKGFASSASFNLVNVEKPRSVSFKKVSGSLPSGLKFEYDAVTGRALLSGTPKKLVLAQASEWAVSVRSVGASGGTGVSSAFSVTVADPSEYNPYLGTIRSATIPLLSEGGYFAGTLTVSITGQNKISAKYAGTESRTASFSGYWNDLDEGTGKVTAVLTKSDAILELTMDKDGVLHAVFEATGAYSYFADDEGVRLTGTAALSASGDFGDYAGSYTVTLPVTNTNDCENVTGTATLTLKMTASAANQGKVTYSGYMPNGTKISGSAVLSQSAEAKDCALLPIFKRTTSDVFAAILKIRANAASTWGQSGSETIWTVAGETAPYQLHRQVGYSFLATMDVFGGYYEQKSEPDELAETHKLLDDMEFQVAGEATADLTATDKGFTVKNAPSGFSLSFNKTTGVFSGKMKVLNSQGKLTSAKFQGVLLPGWTGCGACGEETVIRPFGSGTLYCSDKVNGKTVTRSVPVDIIATEKP